MDTLTESELEWAETQLMAWMVLIMVRHPDGRERIETALWAVGEASSEAILS